MTQSYKKQGVFLFKIIIVGLSAYYIGTILKTNINTIFQLGSLNHVVFWPIMILTICIYILLLASLASSWVALIGYKQSKTLFVIYLKSQALKYLPGNVMHFLYRHSESKKAGLEHKLLINTALNETFCLVFSAITVASILYYWPANITHFPALFNSSAIKLTLAIVFIVLFLGLLRRLDLKTLILALAGHYIYFIGMGIICLLIIYAVGFAPWPLFNMMVVFAIAWLAGYLIPGAPGGLGVREATFIYLGSDLMNQGEALVLIAIVRVISVTGEIVVYLMAKKLVPPKISHQA